VLAVAALALTLLAGACWLAERGRPLRSGTRQLAGLSAPVSVRWDAWGVPHLKGARGRDLAAAMGYIHANDRMTQLELGRRRVAGRLAEVAGPAALEMDLEARQLRLRQTAERLWQTAAPETRAWLEAYALGVNAWLEQHSGDLPPSLTLPGIRPEPWTPVDSLGFVMLMARDLSFWQGRPEELRFRWLRRLGPERTRDLIGDADLHLPAGLQPTGAPAAAATVGHGLPDLAPGSNAWALGTARSAEGAPLLASDPHLRLRLPGTWYQAQLRSPDYQAAGMTLPGLPLVVIGQSAELAWGLTNLMLDDHDLFFEQLDGSGLRVRRGEGWQALQAEQQTIIVKGAAPLHLTLYASERGPLLPAEPQLGLPPRSLAWTAYLNRDPMAPFLHLARARRVEEVPAGLDGFAAPAQNLIVADRHGGLLHAVLGELPRRRKGDGRLPAPGWDSAYGWDGSLPAEGFIGPSPGDGMLVSANDAAEGARDLPVGDYDVAARADRIRELLNGRPRWHAEELAAVQGDVVSAYAREVVGLSAGDYPGTARGAYQALAAWDGRMGTPGAAALFALYERALEKAVFADELELAEVSGLQRRKWLLRLLRGQMDEAWFDDRGSAAVREDRHSILSRALQAAWQQGAERWGGNVGDWRYDELHRLTLRHPFGMLPVIGRLFNLGPFALDGSATTVAAFGASSMADPDEVRHGVSMRWIAVVGEGDRSLAVLPGGQSGHPLDPHYDDQLPLFRAGRLHEASWSEERIRRNTVSTLQLVP